MITQKVFPDKIIYYKDAETLLFSKFEVNIKKDSIYKLKANIYGEKINPEKHELRDDAKAVTLYKFKIEKIKSGFKVRFILDI